MLLREYDAADGLVVCRENRGVARLEVDAPHLPVYTPRERFIIVATKTYVKYWGGVFVFVELAATGLGVGVVKVDVLVPGGDEKPGGCSRGEGYGGDDIGRVLSELKLAAHGGGGRNVGWVVLREICLRLELGASEVRKHKQLTIHVG